MDVWDKTYTAYRFPFITDLRADPFEFAQRRNASWLYQQWTFRRGFVYVPVQELVGGFMASFKEFPPRNKPASFSVGDALKMLETAPHGK